MDYSTNYVKITRDIFGAGCKDLSTSAKWLYCVLCNLEYKYRSETNNIFYRTFSDLAKDSGLSVRTVKSAKAELEQVGLISTKQMHFIGKDGKRSTKHVTGYVLH